MSARRLASVADSWSPVGRSATRARIASGSVSWRRRLCAFLGETGVEQGVRDGGVGAVADAGNELAAAAEHAGEPLDALA